MPPCQGGCREFEPRLPLHKKALDICLKAFLFLARDIGEKLLSSELRERAEAGVLLL